MTRKIPNCLARIRSSDRGPFHKNRAIKALSQGSRIVLACRYLRGNDALADVTEHDKECCGIVANTPTESQLKALEKNKSMLHSFMRHICFVALGFMAVSLLSAQSNQHSFREVAANVDDTRGPVDRFFDLSVGSDYPGTLIRDDSQAQLKLVTRELGFRYIRFHAIFHDVLETIRVEDGKTVYDWTKIDQLYDDLLARNIKPFVELGFTPKALATSENSIFYWHGNTSHPKPNGWRDLVRRILDPTSEPTPLELAYVILPQRRDVAVITNRCP